jgi:hypothetical protein
MRHRLVAAVSAALILVASVFSPAAASTQPFEFGLYDQAMSHLQWDTDGMPAPQIAVGYYAWGEGFQAGFAQTTYSHGAEPFVELGSWQCTWLCPDGQPTLAKITSGEYDQPYLIPFAKAIAAYGYPVLITFDHEMNGCCWYPWQTNYGQRGANPPASYVAAWQHVYNVIHPLAPNAMWVWAPNSVQPGSGPVAAYWPGVAYVDQWGVDSYLTAPGDTYAAQTAPTVAAIRELTSAPGFLAETGIEPEPGRPAAVKALARAARADGLTGLVWFDEGGSFLHRPGRAAMAEALRS